LREENLSRKMQSAMNAMREQMLSQIASALGRKPGDACSLMPPPFQFSADSCPGDELIERFTTEANRVGARVIEVNCEDDITNYILHLIDSIAADGVCLSDVIEKQFPHLSTHLLANGTRIVAPHAPGSSLDDYRHSLLDVTIGVTSADYGIAETGTLVLTSEGECHRLLSLLPPVHICLLSATQLVSRFSDLLRMVTDSGSTLSASALTCISGPSRTADIEHTVTLGVHGPREVHVLLNCFENVTVECQRSGEF
jgi:L-lactate dehydrogenase complex protein LldG